MLELADLKKFAGKGAKPAILQGIADHSHWLDDFEIAGARLPQFMAQLAHECDGFKTLEEYASGADYEGRDDLGNTHAGDGIHYKGRGPIQCTGRANYRAFTKWVRKFIPDAPDFEAHPQRICEFPYALLSAIWYWQTRKLNALADRGDIFGISKKINGINKKTKQPNGMADRRAWLARAQKIWGKAAEPVAFAPQEPALPPAKATVEVVQRRLDAMGYATGGIDGDLATMTAGMIGAFRHDRRIGYGGIDDALLRELDQAEAEGFTRPIGEDRRNATARDLAPTSAAVNESWWHRLCGRILAIPSAIGTAVAGAWQYVPDVRERLDPVTEFLSDVPPLVWFALALAIGVIIWRSANKVEAEAVDAHRKGRLI